MKYCEKCKMIIDKDADTCEVCNNALSDITKTSVVTVAVIKGRTVKVLEPVLKDAGIVCAFENTDGNVYNSLNIKVNSESDFRVLVPFEMYSKAFDICLVMSLVTEEDRLVEPQYVENDTETYDEKFEKVTGKKRGAWQMLWMILIIVGACLVIWGVDWVAHLINPALNW